MNESSKYFRGTWILITERNMHLHEQTNLGGPILSETSPRTCHSFSGQPYGRKVLRFQLDLSYGDFHFNFIFKIVYRRHNSVGIVIGYGLEDRALIRGRGKIFLFIDFVPGLGPTQSHIQWVHLAVFPGIKRQGREADHSPPSNAEVKKGGGILRHMSSCHND
jgi:hypothetical protein